MSQPSFGPNYQVYAPYTGSDNVTSASAYLLPPNNTNVAAVSFNQPIKLKLAVANSGAFAYSNTDFQFAAGQTTILANNAWAGAATARSALMANFTDFLQNLESGLELLGTVPLGTAAQVGQAIADLLPAPVAESLFYRYSLCSGFAPGSLPMVDVRPGMILRVETEASQLVSSSPNLNGYVGAGQFLFRVGSLPNPNGNGGRLVTFDPFLGSIKPPTVSPSTSPLVAGGLVDICQTGLARSYVRLFYPASMSNSSQAGNVAINNNPALVGAQTLFMMNGVTNTYPGVTVTPPSAPPPAPPPNVGMVFLGRATIVPQIAIWINGPGGSQILQYVSVGTTLYQVLECFMASVLNVKQPNPAFTLTRTYAGPNSTAFKFNPTTTSLATLLDVPLIAGDVISPGAQS